MIVPPDWEVLGPGHYRKWNPQTMILTTVRFTGEGEKKTMHVRREQPSWVTNAIIEDNVARQNDFKGYGNDEFYHGVRAPMPVWQQIMEKSGFIAGQGYDEKKFKSIVNDRDFYKLKIAPGRI